MEIFEAILIGLIGYILGSIKSFKDYKYIKDLQTRPQRIKAYQEIALQLLDLQVVFSYERESRREYYVKFNDALLEYSHLLRIDDDEILDHLKSIQIKVRLYNEEAMRRRGVDVGRYYELHYDLIQEVMNRVNEIAKDLN